MKQEKFECLKCETQYTIADCSRLDKNNLTYVECPGCGSDNFRSNLPGSIKNVYLKR